MKKLVLSTRINNRVLVSNSFNRYMDEVRSNKLLTINEELELSSRATNLNLSELDREDAIQELVNKNLRFVISVAKQYVSVENSLEDLINEGNYGLIKASRKFDPTKGFRFITYAVWWIRQAMLDYISKSTRTVKIPTNKLTMISRIRNEVCFIEQELERYPTIDEIIEHSSNEYSIEDIKFYLENESENCHSLDKEMIGQDNFGYCGIDFLENKIFNNADTNINNEDINNLVSKLLIKIEDVRSREVIIYLFGLNGEQIHTTREVADKMGVTIERVRQIKQKNLNKLKKLIDIY